MSRRERSPFLQLVATEGDLNAAIQRSHRYAYLRFRDIEDARKRGKRKELRKLVRDVFRSEIVKVSCVHRAGYRHPSSDGYLRLAEKVDPFRPATAQVPWHWKRKASGGARPVVSLPPALKASHKLITSLLAAQLDQPGFIYNLRGRGRDRLVADLVFHLNGGFPHAIRCDIADCFSNINTEALHTLPLPKGAVKNVLTPDNLRFVQRVAPEDARKNPRDFTPMGTTAGLTRAVGPKGLMQGSPASNLILAFFLKDLPSLENDAVLFVYGDDFFIAGRTKEACRVAADTLAEHLARSSFGPLALIDKDTSESGYFEGLGYSFSRCAFTDRWTVALSEGNHCKLDRLHEAAIEEDIRAGFFSRTGVTLSWRPNWQASNGQT